MTEYHARTDAGLDGAVVHRAGALTIVHTVSSLQIGGMEHVVLRLAAAQQAAGHRVMIVALRGGPLVDQAVARGLVVRELGRSRSARLLDTVRLFMSVRPDIVHAHNPTSLHYAVLSRIVPRAAVVITLHGDQETHARLGSDVEWRLVSATVAVSHAAARTLTLPRHAPTPTVIHNGIVVNQPDSALRQRVRAELGIGSAFAGVMVARVDGRKGHRTLLSCLRSLAAARRNVIVFVIGDGAERAALEAEVREQNLADVMRCLGSRSDVDRFLEAADFFVLPSDTEGLPLSVLEAMAHGLPVVASRVGGLPELIDDGIHGFLVPAGDAAAVGDAICRLMDDAVLRRRLGEAARSRAATQFSMESVARRYTELYERVAPRSRHVFPALVSDEREGTN